MANFVGNTPVHGVTDHMTYAGRKIIDKETVSLKQLHVVTID